MEKFVVSARKYRPQNFNTVVGQSHITTTLKNAIKHNQLAHAFLFCGPRGVGKTTCARILAKTINCLHQTPEGEACNVCSSCVSFDAGSSMNIHELDAASNNSIEDIRSLVEQVRFAPQAGKYKVYIVDEVHMLSNSAFNAFLKTLEEPPSYAIFILATTEKHKILPTILSRCQIFDFKRITTNDTVEHLQEIVDKEGIVADKASLQVIAQKSEGCMRDSLSILDKIVSFTNGEVNYQNTLEHLNILDHDYYFKLLESLLAQDMAGAILLYDEINRKGFEGDMVLNGFAEFIRNILVCKDARAIKLLDVVEGMQEKYKTVAASVSAGYLVSALNILNEAEVNFKMARNKRLHVELVIIKLNFLQQAIELTMQEGSLVKKKRVDGPIAIKYAPIKQVQFKVPNTTASMGNVSNSGAGKVYIEEKKEQSISPSNQSSPVNKVTAHAATVIPITHRTPNVVQEPIQPIVNPIARPSVPISTTSSTATSVATRGTLLDTLRNKYGDKYTIQPVIDPISLTIETLQTNWDVFANKLKEENKISQGNAFAQASLEVVDENIFKIQVDSALQQKFIEQEKMNLSEYLQKLYHNNLIAFVFEMSEGERDTTPTIQQLNSKQRFERIAEKYPLIRELRDNLRLDLDYY